MTAPMIRNPPQEKGVPVTKLTMMPASRKIPPNPATNQVARWRRDAALRRCSGRSGTVISGTPHPKGHQHIVHWPVASAAPS